MEFSRIFPREWIPGSFFSKEKLGNRQNSDGFSREFRPSRVFPFPDSPKILFRGILGIFSLPLLPGFPLEFLWKQRNSRFFLEFRPLFSRFSNPWEVFYSQIFPLRRKILPKNPRKTGMSSLKIRDSSANSDPGWNSGKKPGIFHRGSPKNPGKNGIRSQKIPAGRSGKFGKGKIREFRLPTRIFFGNFGGFSKVFVEFWELLPVLAGFSR